MTARWCSSGGADVFRAFAEQPDRVLDESDQDVTRGGSLTRVAQHDGHLGIEVKRLRVPRPMGKRRAPSKQFTATTNGMPWRSK